jgi:hypothetical protein
MLMHATALALVFTLASASTTCAQDNSDWIGVLAVAAGSALRVDADRAETRLCRLVAADDRGITLVNTAGLPRAARRVVADAAESHPERLLNGAAEFVEGNVRIDRDGLWTGSHLVLARDRLVQRIDKADVREIRYEAGGYGIDRKDATIIGMIAGAAIIYYFAAVISCGPGAAKAECQGIARMLMPVGAGAGAALGHFAGGHRKQPATGVVYRRP